VERRWISFDRAVTNKEFLQMPESDRLDLFEAMKRYRLLQGIGYVVKNYGDGLMMIKPNSPSAGRCLFFIETQQGDVTILKALLAYKKESDEVPKHIESTARARMRRSKEIS
jgi:hypothetical protein